MCVYCNPTDSLSKTPDMFPHILKMLTKQNKKLVIGHQKYKITVFAEAINNFRFLFSFIDTKSMRAKHEKKKKKKKKEKKITTYVFLMFQ